MNKNTKGIVFIVDVSGYSKFINEIDTLNGVRIISRLFNAIIENNHLSFKISEIEGDAILFYHFGRPIAVEGILAQFRAMLDTFNQQIGRLKKQFPVVEQLSLKAIVHYGTMEEYAINRFYKLFGKTLVDAHRLLKNSILTDTYALITKEYVQALEDSGIQYNLSKGYQQCELYDIGNLCYTYFPFKNTKQEYMYGSLLYQ